MAIILAPLAASYPFTTSPCTYYDGIAVATNTRGVVLMSEPIAVVVTVDGSGNYVEAARLSGITEILRELPAPFAGPAIRTVDTAGRYRALRVRAALSSAIGSSPIAPQLQLTTASLGTLQTAALTNVQQFILHCNVEWLVTFTQTEVKVFGTYVGRDAGTEKTLTTLDTFTRSGGNEALQISVGGRSESFNFRYDHLIVELI